MHAFYIFDAHFAAAFVHDGIGGYFMFSLSEPEINRRYKTGSYTKQPMNILNFKLFRLIYFKFTYSLSSYKYRGQNNSLSSYKYRGQSNTSIFFLPFLFLHIIKLFQKSLIQMNILNFELFLFTNGLFLLNCNKRLP